MSLVKSIGRGVSQAFLSDEVRIVLFASFILSLLDLVGFSLIAMSIAGVVCSGIMIVYLLESPQIMKFFWAGFAFSTILILYSSAPDMNTLKLGPTIVITDRPTQALVLLTAGVFNGYTAQKYLGGTPFIMTVAEKMYDREIFLLSRSSSILERLFVISSTDDLNLLDAMNITSKSYVFAVNTKAGVNLLEAKSKKSFSDLIALVQTEEEHKGIPCNFCGTRGTYRFRDAEEEGETPLTKLSRPNDDYCEDCIMSFLKLATEQDVIEESELYARIA